MADGLQQRAKLAPRRPLAADFERSADSVPVLDEGVVADAEEELDAFYLESLEDPEGKVKGDDTPAEGEAKGGAPSKVEDESDEATKGVAPSLEGEAKVDVPSDES